MYCPVCDAFDECLLPDDGAEWLGRGRDGDGEGVRYGFPCFFPLAFGGGVDTVGWMGCGFGRVGRGTSSMGTLKQQQIWSVCLRGFGRAILVGLCCCFPPDPLLGLCAFPVFVCAMRPRRSANVSMLVRSSSIGVCVVLGPGLDLAERLACSLCCQQ